MSSVRLSFVILDVFTSTRYLGNPLAVVHLPQNTSLSHQQKLLIAREFNLSETVFIHHHAPDADVPIDIFMVGRELPFAGHPTIGSAFHILSQRASLSGGDDVQRCDLIEKAGPIRAIFDPKQGVAMAEIPHNVHIHSTRILSSDVLRNQPRLDSVTLQNDFPVVSIVKGMTFALIELPDIDALAHVGLSREHLECDLDEGWNDAESFIAAYFFVRFLETENGIELRTRMIDTHMEDPATGSAASALACYLALQANAPGAQFDFKIAQGVEMGRRSDIGVRVMTKRAGDAIDSVVLSGGAVLVSEGTLLI